MEFDSGLQPGRSGKSANGHARADKARDTLKKRL